MTYEDVEALNIWGSVDFNGFRYLSDARFDGMIEKQVRCFWQLSLPTQKSDYLTMELQARDIKLPLESFNDLTELNEMVVTIAGIAS